MTLLPFNTNTGRLTRKARTDLATAKKNVDLRGVPSEDLRDRNHRRVWQFLVDDYGNVRSMDTAYDVYKTQFGSKAMSRETFKAYAGSVPEGTRDWVWTLREHKYSDPDTVAYSMHVSENTDTTPSHWAQNLQVYIDKLTPAEQRAVDAFRDGEDVSSSAHPLYKSFGRAKSKLKNQLLVDGYQLNNRPRIRHSEEGTGGRYVSAGNSRIKLPTA